MSVNEARLRQNLLRLASQEPRGSKLQKAIAHLLFASDFDPKEIGEVEEGALESEPGDEAVQENFTQQEFSELRTKTEEGTLEDDEVADLPEGQQAKQARLSKLSSSERALFKDLVKLAYTDKKARGPILSMLREAGLVTASRGPDPKGRNWWKEKANPQRWVWSGTGEDPAFTVTEHDAPFGKFYKLQILLPDGTMLKTHGQKADEEGRLHWFSRASRLFNAWHSAAGFDLSRTPEKWVRMAKKLKVDDLVHGGKGEDYDWGHIQEIKGNQALVAWEGSSTKTWTPLSTLNAGKGKKARFPEGPEGTRLFEEWLASQPQSVQDDWEANKEKYGDKFKN